MALSERQMMERLKELQMEDKLKKEQKTKDVDTVTENVASWVLFYRDNINLFISSYLQIKTFPYQHLYYYEANKSTQLMALQSRGTAKTFENAVFANARCLLYPYEKVIITAKTFGQACTMVEEKMIKELYSKEKLSPVLTYLYETGYITKTVKDQKVELLFKNGSTITVVPPLDTVRGLRATIIIYDECRLISKHIVDSVFSTFFQPRTAEFLSDIRYISYAEETKEIFITSVRTSNEWYYTMYQHMFEEYFKNPKSGNRVFAIDIYLGIKYGLKTVQWFYNKKKTMDDLEFRMEVLNEILRENNESWFKFSMFDKNRILENAFISPSTMDLISGDFKCPEFREDEFRIVFVDFAFSNTTGKTNNDLTAIGILSCYRDEDDWIREMNHLEVHGGSENDLSLRRIRELYYDFKCSYIVYDNRNGGTINYGLLTREYIHEERTFDLWNKSGFTIAPEALDLGFVSGSSYDEFVSRTVDQNAIPCLIPFTGTSERNSDMWYDLTNVLRKALLLFLIDDIELQEKREDDEEYFLMSGDEKANLRLPYIQTLSLINEAVSLKKEIRGGLLKLKEPSSSIYTKDRIVALGMGNLFSSKLIEQLDKGRCSIGNSSSSKKLSFIY